MVDVRARQQWNRTPYWLSEGRTYLFYTSGTWIGGTQLTTAEGFHSPLREPFKRLRRVPEANLLSMIGSINRDASTSFDIGRLTQEGRPYTAVASGRLFAFANDVRLFSYRKSGTINLEVVDEDTRKPLIEVDEVSHDEALPEIDEIAEGRLEELNRQGRMGALSQDVKDETRAKRLVLDEAHDATLTDLAEQGEIVSVFQRRRQAGEDAERSRQSVRDVWDRFDYWAIAGEFIGASLLIAIGIAITAMVHVAINQPPEGISYFIDSVVAGALVLLTTAGMLSVLRSRARARRHYTQGLGYSIGYRYYFASLPYIASAGLLIAAYFLSSLEFLNDLIGQSDRAWTFSIAGSSPVVVALYYLGYRVAHGRLKTRESQTRLALSEQHQKNEPLVKESNEEIEEWVGLAVSNAIRKIERARGVLTRAWDSRVPAYEKDRAANKLIESYDNFMDTDEFLKLSNDLDTLNRSTIGIAGERGAGKTGLMRALKKHADSRDYLTIWMSAPTATKEPEFLLSVLARLASQAGVRLTRQPMWPESMPAEELRLVDRSRAAIVRVTLIVLVSLVVGVAIPWPTNAWMTALRVGGGGVIAAMAIGWWFWSHVAPRQLYRQAPEHTRGFLFATHSLLESLWFEQRQSSSSGVSVAGLGLGLTSSSSRQKTRRPFTLPHLVHVWNSYVEYLTTGTVRIDDQDHDGGSRGVFPKVVVFIDEVDKISSSDEIGRFMRILKTLFAPSNLFFIVSISEDAYNRFRARAIASAKRDEFDSSFDRMVKLERMSCERTGELIDSRIFGFPMPRPFVELIWANSRGNPRDSIRLARAIVQEHAEARIGAVSRSMVSEHYMERLVEESREELRGKLNSSIYFDLFQELDKAVAILRKGKKDSGLSLALANGGFSRPRSSKKRTSGTSSSKLRRPEGQRLAFTTPELDQLKVGLYFAETLCDTFSSRSPKPKERFQALWEDNQALLRKLDEARTLLERDGPDQALFAIEGFRQSRFISLDSVL